MFVFFHNFVVLMKYTRNMFALKYAFESCLHARIRTY